MPTQSTASRSENAPAENALGDGRADFDFFFGRWNVNHRRLQKRLQGDTNWDVFGGTCEVRPILGGLGNVDDNVIGLPGGAYRCGPSIRRRDNGRSGGSTAATRRPSMFRCAAHSKQASARSCVKTSSTDAISWFASCGRRSLKDRRAGSRLFHRMAAIPGRSTGSWISTGKRRGDRVGRHFSSQGMFSMIWNGLLRGGAWPSIRRGRRFPG
jgi:hypothetical protein